MSTLIHGSLQQGVPQLQIHDILSPLNQTSFGSGMSTVTKQFLLQLMDYVFGNTRSVMDSAPSQQTRRLDESLLQSLSAHCRRTNTVISNTSSSDVVQAFVDLLRNSNFISDKTQLSDLKSEKKRISTTNGHTTGINGLNHSTNSQKTDCSTAASVGGANRYSSSSAPVRQYPAESVIAASTAETKPTAPPPPYPSYQPSVPPPPPTSSYNTQLFTAPSNSLQNVCPPITQPTPARSSTTAAVPKHPDSRNFNQYLIGRFPPPHYYSPFQ